MNQTPLYHNKMDNESFRHKLPDKPGVYLFKDLSGKVIYVGKAKNLKKRLSSYFRSLAELPYKTALMMKKADDLDYILTATEKEAFILESNLIKKHKPHYNIILTDDKQYPCLRLDIKAPYPRLGIVRRIKKDGAIYFGPFSSAHSVRSTLKLIDRVFQLRKCKGTGLRKRPRPCLNYQLDRCLGPCSHDIPPSNYREIINQVRLFLEGRNRELIRALKDKMELAVDKLNFEKAARIRDQINAVEATIERQNMVSPRLEDQDIIGLAQKNGIFQTVILFVRRGYLLGSRDYLLKNEGESTSEVMEAFLKQYYPKELFIPKQILISEPIEDLFAIADWISDLAGKRITIHHPLKGEKFRLTGLAKTNAENLLSLRKEILKADLMELTGSVLKLKKIPNLIEGLDISNLYGEKAVGAIVSFVDGLPNKSGYRNYRIKGVEGIDDYGMMYELVFRRLSRDIPPDLFVIDGGKGHLFAVKKAMEDSGSKDIPEVVAIAKGDDRVKDSTDKIYLIDRKNPLSLRGDHPVLHLLMNIRDEAHRRAISYHRKIRGKTFKKSQLDLIPGIGFKRKRLLLKYFRNIHAISSATPEDLILVPGISLPLAQKIFDFFKNT